MASELVALAARNNAEWCDAICRANGKGGEFHETIWINPHGTPRFYPDAVTLAGEGATNDGFALVSAALGEQPQRAWSVKDSFADLDLTVLGFSTLFAANWIYRDPAAARWRDRDDVKARILRTDAELATWTKAWSGDDVSLDSGPFRPVLLRDPRIFFVQVERSGLSVGGGVLSKTEGAIGLSNVFADAGCEDAVWQTLIACAREHDPFLPLVGYEGGNDLDAACRNGFRMIGALRVWVRAA